MGHGDTIVYYDDSCDLCERAVIHLSTRSNFPFLGFSTMESCDSPRNTSYKERLVLGESVVYVNGEIVKYKADAIMAMASDLGGIYRLLKLLYLIPRSLRDSLYDLVARNRHRYARTVS